MSLRQTFSWDGFARTGIDPLALVKGAAEIGFDGIEMAPPEYWSMIRDHGLRLVTATAHPLAPQGLAHRDGFAAIQDTMLASLEKAVAADIPMLLCFSGWRTHDPSLSDEEAAVIAAEHLSEVAPHFERAGVTLILELLNTNPNRNYYADSTAWGSSVVGQVGSARVKLLYDIFHMQIMEGDLIRTIQGNKDAIAHYHTAGNPGRADLDDQQEIYYPAVLRSIKAMGYEGWIGHEFFPKGDALEALKAAFRLTASSTT